MTMVQDDRLAELVLRERLLEPGQLDECRRLQRQSGTPCTLAQVIVSRRLATPDALRALVQRASAPAAPPQEGAAEDEDVSFAKFLLGRGLVTKDHAREAYRLLVEYRKTMPTVNLAQVLARHGMADKDVLRDAFQLFHAQAKAAAPPPSFGHKTIELAANERPDYVPFEEGATLIGRPRPTGGAPGGPGQTHGHGGPGQTHGHGGPGQTHGHGGPGQTHGHGGPGQTQPAQSRGGPGWTQPGAESRPGTRPDSFGSNASRGFPTGGVPIGGPVKIDLPEASPLAFQDVEDEEDEEDEAPSRPGPGKTNVESSTFAASPKQRRRGALAKPAGGAKPGRRVPMAALAGGGLLLVLVLGLVISRVLHNNHLDQQRTLFLAAVEEQSAEQALEIGEGLHEDLLAEPDIASKIEALRKRVAAAKARIEAQKILEEGLKQPDVAARLAACDQAIAADETYARAYVERARIRYARAKQEALGVGHIDLNKVAGPAYADLARAMEVEPMEPLAYYVRARIGLENSRNAESVARARRDLQKVKDLAADTPLGLVAQGRQATLIRNFEQAIGLYDQAIDRDPRLVEAYLARARARLAQNNHAGALRDANLAVDLDGASAEALTLRAEGRYFANHDRDGALGDLAAALKLDPTQVRALALQAYVRLERDASGFLLSSKEDLERAERDATQALGFDPDEELAHLVLAEIKLGSDLNRALFHAGKAVDLGQRSTEAFLVRGRLRVIDNDLDHAMADFEQILRLDPNNARALTMKAGILVTRKDLEQARTLLEKALSITNKVPQAYFNRGQLNLFVKPPQRKKAIEDFSEAIGLRSDFAMAYFYRGVALYESERFEDALRDMETAERLRTEGKGPDVPLAEIYMIRGYCNYYKQDWAAAIKAYEEYLRGAGPGSGVDKVKRYLRECKEKLAGGGE